MRELDWDPIRNQWRIWSTVSCSFIGAANTPEQVADFIVGKDEYHYIEVEGRQVVAKARYKSRDELVSRCKAEIEGAQETCWRELTPEGWRAKCVPAEQVRRNLENVCRRDLEAWDKCEICPDPKAKEAVRQSWIEDAKRAQEEKRRVTLVCDVTPEGEVRRLLP